MDAASFIQPTSFAIVVGGTLIATFLRCGPKDCSLALAALAGFGQKRFDAEAAKAELAAQVRAIQQDGLLRANPRHFGDREFDDVTDALIGTRSVEALVKTHEEHKRHRQITDERAVRTLAQAAELAPVFGLAGTLISLTQLPSDGIAREAYMSAISMGVLSTLYGLLLANLVFAPLSRMVERIAATEERERQKIVDWLADQVTPVIPKHGKPVSLHEAAAR